MTGRVYPYIGPEAARREAAATPSGVAIFSRTDLERWLQANPEAQSEAATFIVDRAGRLRLAPRRSEHVACAAGEPVLAAGEVRFERSAHKVAAVEVTNQSTGYCPEPESWPAVEAALRSLGVAVPTSYTQTFIFRRCPTCNQLNLVKDGWFYCAACDAPLPAEWNLD